MSYVEADQAPLRKNGHIKLYGPEGFEGMRRAGQLTAQVLDAVAELVAPGVSTEAIDKLVFDFAMDHGAYPATLMYRGYRYSACAPR